MRGLLCPTCLLRFDHAELGIWHHQGHRPVLVRVEDVRTRKKSLDDRLQEIRDGEYFGCPNGHLMTADLLRYPTLRVALIGPSLSMKSHFIGVSTMQAVDDQVAGYVGPVGFTATCEAVEGTRQVLHDDYHAALRGGSTIGRTLPDVDGERVIRSPITLKVDWRTDRPTVLAPNAGTFNLMLFDAPGELISGTPAEQTSIGPYLVMADVLLFFVDVSQAAPIRRHLPDVERHPDAVDFSPSIVQQTMSVIARTREVSDPIDLGLEAYVILSKADLLEGAAGPLAQVIDRAPAGVGELTATQNEALAEDIVRTFLPGLTSKVRTTFEDPHYFVASALGSAPDAERIGELAPFGCAEILRSILTRRGGIPVGARQ